MFIHTNQPLITSFYSKKVPIFRRISDESALIRTFLRNGRLWVKAKILQKNVKNGSGGVNKILKLIWEVGRSLQAVHAYVSG